MKLLPTDFRYRFRRAGINAGSRSWRDYERGKKVLRTMDLDADQYEEGIKVLTEYLRV